MKIINSKKYYSIGEISDITKISITTLRFYDREGILVPAMRNENSGYRYYAESQMDILHGIKYLQAFGFSLEEIKAFLQDPTSTWMETRVSENIKRVKGEIETLEYRLNSMEFLLNRIQQSRTIRSDDSQNTESFSVEVTTLKKSWVISIRHVSKLDADRLFSDRCLELQALLSRDNLFPAGPYIGVFHGGYEKQFTKEEADLELCIPIILPKGYQSKNLRQFGGETVVGSMHYGHYRDIKKTYDALLQWIDRHEYEIVGPAYEYYFCDLGTTFDESEYLTKIYFPVQEKRR